MPILLITMLVLGAIGLFLLMPGGRRDLGYVGLILLVAAAGALCSLITNFVAGERIPGMLLISSVVALFAAIRVISHGNPVYSALYFVLLILAISGMLLQMQAEFLTAALVLVYAGAILVTYVFVIMLAQRGRPASFDSQARDPLLGVFAGFALLTILSMQFFVMPAAPDPGDSQVIHEAHGTVEAVGTPLLTHYIVAIQIAGLLLLAAMVGAIAIARRQVTAMPEEGDG